jgi:hypothetical protein
MKPKTIGNIYKYTSVNSAIAIVKSGMVVLNNPRNFNDPFDSLATIDPASDKKTFGLLVNYAVMKEIVSLVDNKTLKLTKPEKAIFATLRAEMKGYKAFLKKDPYFTKIAGISPVVNQILHGHPEINIKVEEGKKNFKESVSSAIKKAYQSALISCFSKRNDSILMWSHYAVAHHGVCLEFECPEWQEFRPVAYSKNRPQISLYKAISHVLALDFLNEDTKDAINSDSIKELLDPFFIKSSDWSYEEEVRCLFSSDTRDEKVSWDGFHYCLAMPKIKAAYIGCQASGEDLTHLLDLLSNREIPIVFMKEDEKTYAIVPDPERKHVRQVRSEKKEITLLRLVSDIQKCLDAGAYLSAFVSSLMIPAICGAAELPDVTDPKERYIKWCNTYLPCCMRDPDPHYQHDAYMSGELIWSIKERMMSHGDLEVTGDYKEFVLDSIRLEIESRKALDLYADEMGEKDITQNIRKFSFDACCQADHCYQKHTETVEMLKQIPIRDFDAEYESMVECGIESDNINRRLKALQTGKK